MPYLYFIPMTGTGAMNDHNRPKYLKEMGRISFNAVPYGRERIMLVSAKLTPAQHTDLISNADVVYIGNDGNANLTTEQVASLQTVFGNYNITSGWLSTSLTIAQLARKYIRASFVPQRFGGIYKVNLFGGGVALTRTWGQLTTQMQDRIIAVANSLDLATAGIQDSWTLAEVLDFFMDQIDDNFSWGWIA